MELPTSRELELETLLRQRDSQVTELSEELVRLRRYLSTQPGPSATDPVTLPPSLASLLLPHLNVSSPDKAAHSSVATALTQRAKLLQEENDELYDLLKQAETGKLKEEVRGLRRVVEHVEGALRESHKVIASLTSELDKSYEVLTSAGRQNEPRARYHSSNSPHKSNENSTSDSSKFLPTGPRGQKKRRLSDSPTSPPRKSAHLPAYSLPGPSSRSSRSDHSPRPNHGYSNRSNGNLKQSHAAKMDVDKDSRGRYHQRSRDGPRWERDRMHSKNNAHSDRARSRSPERPSATAHSGGADDRTLAQRMRL